MELENKTIHIIENKIYIIRGVKIMLDSDLAELYQIETKNINKSVKRNIERFPEDFMFQLTKKEEENLKFQNGTSSYGGRRYLPYVFTEHGVAMLSSVLKSKKAIEINILIVRAFIKIREILSVHKDIIFEIENIKRNQKDHNGQIIAIINAVNKLLEPPRDKNKRKIGFRTKE
jgi:phage regulator Rha-like protein